MSTSARRRLLRDFRRLQTSPPPGITGTPLDSNIMLWQALIFGPDDTSWEGGTFKLLMEFTEDYPNKAPSVRFVSRMFHPNIYNDGQICLDILQNQWSPIYDISAILTSIQSLLCDPNPASPANGEASRLYSENRREYNRRVREVVEGSWIEDAGDANASASASSSGGSSSSSSSSSAAAAPAAGGEMAAPAAAPADADASGGAEEAKEASA